MAFAPLPEEPAFTVFGLAGTSWSRWVELWQQAGGNFKGPLYEVILGHQDKDGRQIFVTTTRKLDSPEDDNGSRPYPAVDFSDLSNRVVLNMLVKTKNMEDTNPTFGPDFNQQLHKLADNVGEPRWHMGSLPVDGAAAEFWFTEAGREHAAVADIHDAVATGLNSYDVDLTGMSLQKVNDSLDSYQVGPSITLGSGNDDRPRR